MALEQREVQGRNSPDSSRMSGTQLGLAAESAFNRAKRMGVEAKLLIIKNTFSSKIENK